MRLMKIVKLAAVAAIYVAVTVALQPISYGEIQFRVAELLVLLVFLHRDYAIALVIGCAIANIPSDIGVIDILFGTAGTAVAVLGIHIVARHAKVFGKAWIALAVASLFPVVANGLLVGLELHLVYEVPFIAAAASVALGEFVVVTVVGVPVFAALSKNEAFLSLIDPSGRGSAAG
jgi:uncharacterized membrane protein